MYGLFDRNAISNEHISIAKGLYITANQYENLQKNSKLIRIIFRNVNTMTGMEKKTKIKYANISPIILIQIYFTAVVEVVSVLISEVLLRLRIFPFE